MPHRRQMIGRYKVQSLVGEGATAFVYKAWDPAIDRTLAIKILKQEFSADPNFSTRFQREARSAGAISHPGIVTIYDVGQAGETPTSRWNSSTRIRSHACSQAENGFRWRRSSPSASSWPARLIMPIAGALYIVTSSRPTFSWSRAARR